MALTFPNVRYVSGDFSTPVACTLPEFAAPIEGQTGNYVLSQDFICNLSSFTPLALNTPHPDFPTYYLVSEGEKRDIGGGKVRWTRVYAQVPATYTEPGGSYAYNYIGFVGNVISQGGEVTLSVTGRERKVENSPVQITREFFLVGTGQTYTQWQSIPVISGQRYYGATGLDTDYLTDAPPFVTATNPTRTAYLALVTADAASPSSFSLVVEDSTVTRWMGNIYMRETRRIKAK
jgi:hypothetical protein